MQTVTLQLDSGPMVADVYDPPGGAVGLPVLLIHGWGGSGRYWRSTIERLGARFRLIVPDLPGVGRSLPVHRALDMAGQRAALEGLLAQLGISRAHVVGHSMGGGIGMLLAARRPELVERLVLTSISLFKSEAERQFFGNLMKVAAVLMRFRAGWMAHLPWAVRGSARRVFYRLPDDPALLHDSFVDYLEMDYATAVACAQSAASSAVIEAARQVRAPTLLVAARQDQMMPTANVALTSQTLGNCPVVWFEHCGHMPMVEYPDAYARVVGEFLAVP